MQRLETKTVRLGISQLQRLGTRAAQSVEGSASQESFWLVEDIQYPYSYVIADQRGNVSDGPAEAWTEVRAFISETSRQPEVGGTKT